MERVSAIVDKEGWGTNLPEFTDVRQAWVSNERAAIEDDEAILKSVTDQKWKGIEIKDFGERKGKGEQTK